MSLVASLRALLFPLTADLAHIREYNSREKGPFDMNTDKIKLCAFADEADPSLDGQIEALKANDITLLEIRGVDGKNISAVTVEEAKEIRKKLDANGIPTWSIGSPAGKIKIDDDFDKEVETFKRMLEVGAVLDAKCMRLFSFFGTNCEAQHFGPVCEKLNKYVELCKPYGIVPCHENEKGIYGERAPHCLMLLKAVPGLRAVFDPANFIQCKQDTLQAWDMLKDFVYYGHIKDAESNGRVVPAGQGIGHIPEYLPDFVAHGCSVLTLEPHLHKFVGLSDLEEEGARSDVGQLSFANSRESFDYAVNALKAIINNSNL
jgi:sugar phosphate isomerase/epimerase